MPVVIDYISSVFETFLQFVFGLVDSAWSLAAMGALAMGDSLIPILPSGTLVSAMGASAAAPGARYPLWLIIIVAAVCALVGDLLVYLLGRITRFQPKGRLRKPMEFFEGQFASHWQIILSTARFIPIVRIAAFLAAGMVRVPWRRVVVMDGLAALIWAIVYTLCGYLGGTIMDSPVWGMLIGVLVGAVAGLSIAQAARFFQTRRLST